MKLILFSTEDSKNDVSRLENTSAAVYHSFHFYKCKALSFSVIVFLASFFGKMFS
mgnify:CR=1 FL=1